MGRGRGLLRRVRHPLLELLQGLAEGPGQLRDLLGSEEHDHDHKADDEILRS